jgi:hypothetical protein
MEGGFYPWKNQSRPEDELLKYGNYSNLRKPLPKPPRGYSWEKDEKSGEWLLLDEATGIRRTHVPKDDTPTADAVPIAHVITNATVVDVAPAAAAAAAAAAAEPTAPPLPPPTPEFLEHTVVPSDTLIGICLRYKVSQAVLRRHNSFPGENFRLCETLRIPAAAMAMRGAAVQPQARTPEVLLQEFRNRTGLEAIEARLYLEETGKGPTPADWDLDAALAAWAADVQWESEGDAKVKLARQQQQRAREQQQEQEQRQPRQPR